MSAVFRHELRIAYHHRAELANPLWFFVIAVALFPLAVGPEPLLLARIAPGIIWVVALLSALMAFERLFHDDFLDGTLEQLMLLPVPLPAVVLAKVFAHWVVTGLPLILLSPLATLLLGMDFHDWCVMAQTLLLGTPVLSFFGALGAALTLRIQHGGVLLSVLVLPLCIPLLIFATAALGAGNQGLPVTGDLAVLGAMLTASMTLLPFATTAALRLSVQ